jgi:hypothetical protein
MGYISPPPPFHRLFETKIAYVKKYAIFPVYSSSGEKIWWTSYYKKYKFYHYSDPDFISNLTEADCIIDKLSDNL